MVPSADTGEAVGFHRKDILAATLDTSHVDVRYSNTYFGPSGRMHV